MTTDNVDRKFDEVWTWFLRYVYFALLPGTK